ncbi:MAG TPA: Asp-tRNA(Asn)/Glu-tRNA(Gln) amidotransferase subunit GatC [Bacteroidetes bacterium]|nr:Asp-tRNA(Asn)/Glu-tRNA(Gln) amidotransferase subunit GatC [Bacteroidota bacterium]
MKISRAEVEKTALLARLEFDDQELERMRADLNTILEYAEKLQQLDLDNVPETEHVLSLQNVFREDAVQTWLDNEAALRNAPARKNGYFSIPKVIG